jgi:hypothetical protein
MCFVYGLFNADWAVYDYNLMSMYISYYSTYKNNIYIITSFGNDFPRSLTISHNKSQALYSTCKPNLIGVK